VMDKLAGFSSKHYDFLLPLPAHQYSSVWGRSPKNKFQGSLECSSSLTESSHGSILVVTSWQHYIKR
jgi:hypothetical protein